MRSAIPSASGTAAEEALGRMEAKEELQGGLASTKDAKKRPVSPGASGAEDSKVARTEPQAAQAGGGAAGPGGGRGGGEGHKPVEGGLGGEAARRRPLLIAGRLAPQPPVGGLLEELGQGLYGQVLEQTSELTDCEFLLGDGSVVLGHRGVVSARSEFFRCCFMSGMEESKTGIVRVRDCTRKVFLKVLEFLYTAALTPDEDADVLEVLSLCDILGVKGLRHYLCGSIDASNVAAAAQHAEDAHPLEGSEELLAACVAWAAGGLRDVPRASLQGLSAACARRLLAGNGMRPKALEAFTFAEAWCLANPGRTEEEVAEVMRGVELRKLPGSFVGDAVRGSGLLSEKGVGELLAWRGHKEAWGKATFVEVASLTEGDLMEPCEICVLGADRVAILDGRLRLVIVCDANLQILLSFGEHGYENGQFASPAGMGACPDGSWVAVSDCELCRVQVFSARTGEFVRAFGGVGRGPGQLQRPTGVCVDKDNNILVSDWGNHRVCVFSEEGAFLREFGQEMDEPCGIAVNAEGAVAVTESGGNVRPFVQVFSSEGRLLRRYEQHGGLLFDKPCAIAFNKFGDLAVSDWSRHCVVLLDSEGEHLQDISISNGIPFDEPSGIAVNEDGTMYVADLHNSRVVALAPSLPNTPDLSPSLEYSSTQLFLQTPSSAVSVGSSLTSGV